MRKILTPSRRQSAESSGEIWRYVPPPPSISNKISFVLPGAISRMGQIQHKYTSSANKAVVMEPELCARTNAEGHAACIDLVVFEKGTITPTGKWCWRAGGRRSGRKESREMWENCTFGATEEHLLRKSRGHTPLCTSSVRWLPGWEGSESQTRANIETFLVKAIHLKRMLGPKSRKQFTHRV